MLRKKGSYILDKIIRNQVGKQEQDWINPDGVTGARYINPLAQTHTYDYHNHVAIAPAAYAQPTAPVAPHNVRSADVKQVQTDPDMARSRSPERREFVSQSAEADAALIRSQEVAIAPVSATSDVLHGSDPASGQTSGPVTRSKARS